MAAETTVHIEFYSPWPNLGKKLSEQLGEIRTDTSSLEPIVRGAGLDASGDFSNLDGVAKSAVQAWEIGEQDFHNRFRTHYNKTTDVFEIAYNNGTTDTPNWYTTWWIDKDGQVTQQNTPTTASNVGGGLGWFKQKTGVDLEFRTITATSPITIVNDGNSLDVDGSALVSTYSSDRAAAPSGDADTGIEIILSDTGKVGNDLPFKALKAGPNVVIRNLSGTAIEIESTAQVVEFYGIAVSHSDGSVVYPEIHDFKVNVMQFYLTQRKSNPSAKSMILNFRGNVLQADDFVAVIGDEMTGPLKQADGSVGAPSYTWTSDSDTGIRRRADNDMAFVSGGADIARVLTDRLLVSKQLQVTTVTNDPATPDIFWNPDSDTGLYQVADDDGTIAFATAGVRAGYFDNAQDLFVTNELKVGDGDAATPGFAFVADATMGMYRKTTDQLAFATAGTIAGYWDASQDLIVINHAVAGNGAVGAPSFSVSASDNTGIWKHGTGTSLGFAVGGNDAARLDDSGFMFLTKYNAGDGSAGNPSYTFTSDADSGMFLKSDNVVGFSAINTEIFNISSSLLTMSKPIMGHSGSESAPSFIGNISGGDDTGMYFTDANAVLFTVSGTRKFSISENSIGPRARMLMIQGSVTDSATSPAYSWSPDNNTGMFSATADHLEFTTGGTRAGYFDPSQNLHVTNDIIAGGGLVIQDDLHVPKIVAGTGEFYEQLRIADGTAGAPGFAFLSDPDTGFFLSAPNVCRFLTGGGKRLEIADSYTYIINKLRLPGSTSVSSLATQFTDDTNTGVFRRGVDQYAWATGGAEAGYFDENQNLHVTKRVFVEDEAYTRGGWNNDFSVPTKNAVSDMIVELQSNRFYLTVKHTDDTHVNTDVGLIAFDVANFYLHSKGDEVSVHSRDRYVDKSGDDMFGVLVVDPPSDTPLSRFGPVISYINANGTNTSLLANLINTASGGIKRTIFCHYSLEGDGVTPFTGQAYALNAVVNTRPGITTDATKTGGAGTGAGGRYFFKHRGSGTIAEAGGVASEAKIQSDMTGILTDSWAYIDEGGDGGNGSGELTTYHGFWSRESRRGVVDKNCIRLDDENNVSGNFNGILSVITDGADKLFINHTGTASSFHNGIWTQGDALVMGNNNISGVNNLTFTIGDGRIAGIRNEDLVDKSTTETIAGVWTHSAALTMSSADVVMGDNNITGVNNITFTDTAGAVAGIQNQNLLDLAVDETVTGNWTFSGNAPIVTDEAYDASGWDGDFGVPTKNAVRDKIETIESGGSGGSGFYGITVAHSDDSAIARGINTIKFDQGDFYITQNVGNTDEVHVNFRGLDPSAGQANTASNLGVDTFGLFNGKVDVDLQFKSLIAGTDIELQDTGTEIRIVSTATGGGGGGGDQLFYLTAKHSDDSAVFRNLNTLTFNVDKFYLTQNFPNTDEVMINIRGLVEESSSPLWTGKHIFSGPSVAVDATDTDVFVVRRNSPNDGSATFYLNMFRVDTANSQVIVGDSTEGDSVTAYYDQDTLKWSVGYDTDADEFVISSGVLGSFNEINLAVNKIGFFGTTPVAQPTTVTASSAAIIAALETLGIFAP